MSSLAGRTAEPKYLSPMVHGRTAEPKYLSPMVQVLGRWLNRSTCPRRFRTVREPTGEPKYLSPTVHTKYLSPTVHR